MKKHLFSSEVNRCFFVNIIFQHYIYLVKNIIIIFLEIFVAAALANMISHYCIKIIVFLGTKKTPPPIKKTIKYCFSSN